MAILQNVALGLLDDHLKHCVVGAAKTGGPEAEERLLRHQRRSPDSSNPKEAAHVSTTRTILSALATLTAGVLTHASLPTPPRTDGQAGSCHGRGRWVVEVTIRAVRACC